MSRETASPVRYIDKTRASYEAEGYARPYEWSADHSGKDTVLTTAQPFLGPEATRKWLERKEPSRALKATGRI
jgi:hypothetical protein